MGEDEEVKEKEKAKSAPLFVVGPRLQLPRLPQRLRKRSPRGLLPPPGSSQQRRASCRGTQPRHRHHQPRRQQLVPLPRHTHHFYCLRGCSPHLCWREHPPPRRRLVLVLLFFRLLRPQRPQRLLRLLRWLHAPPPPPHSRGLAWTAQTGRRHRRRPSPHRLLCHHHCHLCRCQQRGGGGCLTGARGRGWRLPNCSKRGRRPRGSARARCSPPTAGVSPPSSSCPETR
mmetsp:Transcript_40461/g.81615  ORF Transcript_40461/g.81615 Transcript_40461/m.81615 type:complete len:228 (+) Transcript_40461:239-922(+)